MPIKVNLPDGRIVNFPDGMSPEQITAEVTKLSPPEPAQQAPPSPPRTGADDVRDALQWGGKVIAGMTGMGSAGRDAVEHPVETLAGVVIPGAIGKGLQAAGRGIYRGGVALLPKTLKQQFPNIADTGLNEGIALTKRGASAADARVGASRAEADATIASAEAAGKGPVSPRRVITEFRPVRDTVQKRAALGMADETPAVAARARLFASHNKGGIPLTKAQGLKREAQDLAESAYRAQDRGANVNGTDLLMNEAQARGLRQEIERAVPDVGPINRRTQDLVGLTRAAEHASGTGHGLMRLGGAGALGLLGSGGGALPAMAAAGTGAMLSTPGGLTSLGLLTRTGGKVLPGAMRAALLAQMMSDEPQQ